MRSIQRWGLLGLLPMVLALGGCSQGPSLGEVEGTVKIGGKPAANVFVQFLPEPNAGPKGTRSTATTDSNGRYRLQFDDPKNPRDGASLGWHKVIVEDLETKPAPQGEPATASQTRISARYGNVLSTPFRQEVKPGKQTIDLDVTNQ